MVTQFFFLNNFNFKTTWSLPSGRNPKVKSITVAQKGSSISLTCRVRGGRGQEHTVISWQKNGVLLKNIDGEESLKKGKNWRQVVQTSSDKRKMIVRTVRTSKSILMMEKVEEEDAGVFSCLATNPSGTHRRDVRVTIQRRALEPSATTSTTSTTTTTTVMTTSSPGTPSPRRSLPAPSAARLRLLPFPPGHVGPCPIPGFCLNSGTCSYISWLGELSCACAPGFQGRRCESKATSALYSAHLPSPLSFRY